MSEQQRLNKIHFSQLKNLKHVDINFDGKRVVGIFGPNGCGKSTIIHTLLSIYKPKTDKGQNCKFSDFFKSDEFFNWRGSKFKMFYYERNGRVAVDKTYQFEKKRDRWLWHYESRPDRDVYYIGIRTCVPDIEMETVKNPTIKTHRKATPVDHSAEICRDASIVMGVDYDDLFTSTSLWKKDYLTVENAMHIRYKSLCMGAGEQRIFKILSTLHNADNYSLVIIDEIDLTLHKAALDRLMQIIVRMAESKKLQVIFTSHREELTKRDDIDIRHIFQTPGKTFCFENSTPECLDRMTGAITRPLDIYVEDDMAKNIVTEFLSSIGKVKRANIQTFGAIENAFSVASGLSISGKLTDNVILLTDGDKYANDAEKLTQIHKHFTGTEEDYDERCNNILAHIKQFCPNRAGVSPETYIWETLKSSEIENEITEAARSISYVDDTHRYVGDIIDQLNFSKEVGQTKVCEQFRCETHRWDNYIVQLADWINNRIAAGVI